MLSSLFYCKLIFWPTFQLSFCVPDHPHHPHWHIPHGHDPHIHIPHGHHPHHPHNPHSHHPYPHTDYGYAASSSKRCYKATTASTIWKHDWECNCRTEYTGWCKSGQARDHGFGWGSGKECYAHHSIRETWNDNTYDCNCKNVKDGCHHPRATDLGEDVNGNRRCYAHKPADESCQSGFTPVSVLGIGKCVATCSFLGDELDTGRLDKGETITACYKKHHDKASPSPQSCAAGRYQECGLWCECWKHCNAATDSKMQRGTWTGVLESCIRTDCFD